LRIEALTGRELPPLPPGSVIGILGGGQLGRMLSVAASRLGFDVVILDPEPECPASRVSAKQITARYDDPQALEEFARLCHRVTLEFENVPVAALDILEANGMPVLPGARALAITQDRVLEKTFLGECGVSTVPFAAIDDTNALIGAQGQFGLPCVLKSRREGYDGRGQVWIREPQDVNTAFARLGGGPAILEAYAPFVRELSIIAARSVSGDIQAFPLAENRHENGILRSSQAPARVTPQIQQRAAEIADLVCRGLDYVGVIGIELFELADGQLLVNEIAPRVHNSGHWTQDGCLTDQFEQHIRAVAGWPLGDTSAHSQVEMHNLLGDEISQWPQLAKDPRAHLHLYGKSEVRPGRKMGHVNFVRSRLA